MKVALTAVDAFTVMLQADDPEHAPDQAEKTLFAEGASLSVTIVFCGNTSEHVPGQLIPAGLLVTLPDPDTATVNP
jgi:hypothetical protein